MKLREVNFKGMETIRKKCIGFAKDGNTIVKPHKTLYRVVEICGDDALSDFYIEVIDQPYETLYRVWNDLGVICVSCGFVDADMEIADLASATKKYPYAGKNGYLERLDILERNGDYISNLEIEVCKLLGEMALAMNYAEYRIERIQAYEERERAKQAARKELERIREAEQREEIAYA